MKNCTNCVWNGKDTCENSNWKDGSKIIDPLKPGCGYLIGKRTTPLGFLLKEIDENT